MDECHASYRPRPRDRQIRSRNAVIRVGGENAAAGSTKPGYWLTVAEAERLRAELDKAIRLARGCAISGLPPEPPPADAGALPAA